jgi:hypothetical protein
VRQYSDEAMTEKCQEAMCNREAYFYMQCSDLIFKPPHPFYLTSILILPAHGRLGFSKSSLTFSFPNQNLKCISNLPHARYVSHPPHTLGVDAVIILEPSLRQ